MKKIRLYNGMHAIVDDDDFPVLSEYNWYFHKGRNGDGYAHGKLPRGRRNVFMHRLILNAPKGMQVDHINLNKLDNRKSNLRLCTNAENHANSVCRTSSGYKGVYAEPKRKHQPWRAMITVNNKPLLLARCATAEEAAMYYDVAAQLFFGDFARLNRPVSAKAGRDTPAGYFKAVSSRTSLLISL